MKKTKSLFTFIGMVFAGRTAIKRMRQAQFDEDRLELLDAVLNIAVVVTGVIILVRRLREKKELA